MLRFSSIDKYNWEVHMELNLEKGKRLVLISLGLFLLSNFIDVFYKLWTIRDSIGREMGLIVVILLRIGLVMGFAMEARKGENWARWGVIVLAIITTVFSLPGLILLLVKDVRGLVLSAMIVLNLLTFMLMIFQKDIKEYYKSIRNKLKIDL